MMVNTTKVQKKNNADSPRGRHGDEQASKGPASLAALINESGGQVHVACDTEFVGTHTLTAQFAARLGEDLVVQVYHSPAIPIIPADFDVAKILPRKLRHRFQRVILRPLKTLSVRLSPVRVLADLFELDGVKPVSSQSGPSPTRAVADTLDLSLIAHYWPADLFRIFGASYLRNLLSPDDEEARVTVRSHKPLGFQETSRSGRFRAPVLEYAKEAGLLFPVRVRTFDTSEPFGKASLDEFARTFLGVGKLEDIGQDDKCDMLRAFRRKAKSAYGYAVRDAVLTLLVWERMREEDANLYRKLGFTDGEIPSLRPTQGSRVAELLTRAVARAAAGSEKLARKDGRGSERDALVSREKIKQLFHAGSGDFLAGEARSRFGRQTGETHGGLLFSRTPTRFFHAGPGQFRDVDLSGCYASIIAGMSLYVGRPVLWEPGSKGMPLKDAVSYLRAHAAGNDAWMVKVSGRVSCMPNVLIPSTGSALTHSNYRKRAAKKRAQAKRDGHPFDWLYENGKDAGNATLYTDIIEAGMVLWPTWLMIQALPEPARREYEDLEVETILFYPAKLTAATGSEYDTLVARYAQDGPAWTGQLDLDRLEQVIVDRLGDEHVSLRYEIGELARKMIQFRRDARERHGRGSGAELAWKQTANTIYGVLASRHLSTNNVVAANYITATARALAFTMQMSLNGFQVITDGCTYRRDQIPACTLAECLEADPEYPLRRPEGKIPFHDPSTIPEDSAKFTCWYRTNVKRFLAVQGPEYEELFGLHYLEHKTCGDEERVSYDGLCCDGAANYVKLLKDSRWKPVEMKARSYRREAKQELTPWIIDTFCNDQYLDPPPITESANLLSYQQATIVARKALDSLESIESREGQEEAAVYFPLGLEAREVQTYKVIKPSAFLFRTPQQRDKILRAIRKFEEEYGCGLEVLALRRSYHGRRNGSLVDVAEAVYRFIRAGGDNITRELNLTRSFQELDRVQREHLEVLLQRKLEARNALYQSINTCNLTSAAKRTGLHVGRSHPVQRGKPGNNCGRTARAC